MLKKKYRLRHFNANQPKLALLRNVTKIFLAAIFKENNCFQILFQKYKSFMFSYFEPDFIEKFFWESGFSNLGHMTVFVRQNFVFGHHFETEHFWSFFFFFANLWLFKVCTDMVKLSYRNSYGKVLKHGWVQVVKN